MEYTEKRQYRRLEIRLPLECQKVGEGPETAYRTVALNVSTGGLYFETDAEGLEPGTVLNLELTVPPGDGHWPWQGRVSTTAEVVRVMPIRPGIKNEGSAKRVAIAAQFREPLKLSFSSS